MWSSPGKKLQSPSMKPVRRLVISMLALGWIVPSSPRIAHAQEPSVNELLVLDNVTVVDVRTGKLEPDQTRSEEHTSELQSLTNLVCRLLLEKKKSLTPETGATDAPAEDTDA